MSFAREITSAFPQYDEILDAARCVKQFPISRENETKSLQGLCRFENSFILRVMKANNQVITDVIMPVNQAIFPQIIVNDAKLYVTLPKARIVDMRKRILADNAFMYLDDFNEFLFSVAGIRMNYSEKELNILFVCDEDANEMVLRITALKLAHAILKEN